MVDTLIAAAALAAATSNQAEGLTAPAAEPVSPKTGEQVRTAVPVERRRVARAGIRNDADFEALLPLIRRAKVDASLTETRGLLEKAENQIRLGNREQAMLTLDGATLQLERVRPDMKGNTTFIETFMELERRESTLREKLGEPAILPFGAPVRKDAAPGEGDGVAPAQPAGEAEDGKEPVAPPRRDELPVG